MTALRNLYGWLVDRWYDLRWLVWSAPGLRHIRRRLAAHELEQDRRILALLPEDAPARAVLAADIDRRAQET